MTDEIKRRIGQVKNGEVPYGYKKVKSSLYPECWRFQPLNKVLQENKERNTKNFYTKEDVLSVSGDFGVVNQIRLLGRSYAGESLLNYHIVNTGDIVYTKSPLKENPFGIIKLNLGNAGIVSTLYAVYYCKNQVTARYLNYYFQVDKFLNNYLQPLVKKGAKNDMKVNNIDVLKGKIAFALFEEQEKIVEVLNQCDKVIELKKQLIAEERKQRKWLMQNLLNPESGVRLEGFKGEWKEKTMGELFQFAPSLSASREKLGEDGICYLHYGDIHSNTSGIIDVQRDFEVIPKLMIDSIPSKVLLDDGDVVFVDASEDYEGASKYVVVKNKKAIPFIAGLHTIPAKSINEELVLDFKRYCFQSYFVKKQIAFYASGMKVFGLSKVNIAKVILKYPSADEQAAIANILSIADHKIELLEQELEQWKLKKKSLLQLLLMGIVRVNK